jgi:hypothetical protein
VKSAAELLGKAAGESNRPPSLRKHTGQQVFPALAEMPRPQFGHGRLGLIRAGLAMEP